MFTVVETARGKAAGKTRLRRPELTRVPVPGGSFFYVLRAPRRSDPRALLRLAARCAPQVLTALPVPPDCPARLFVPRVFPLRRALAALGAILPETRLPPQKLAVGVLDPDAALCGKTRALLPLASDVRIVTGRPDTFAADASLARMRYGASLTVGEDASLLARCDAVVCPDLHAALRDVPVVLSCVPADGAFSLLPVCLPDALARLCPQSIPPDLFAAALAEKCGVRAPELYACAGVAFAGGSLTVRQAAALWRERIRKKGVQREMQAAAVGYRCAEAQEGEECPDAPGRIFLDNSDAV